ncbi:hypothetical protein DIPPA_34898, partial [Diplonema papillatum]
VLLLRENGMRDLTGIFPKKSIGTVAQQYPPPLLWVVDFSGNEIADLTPLAEQKTLCLGYLSVENNCLPAAQFDVLKDLPVVDIRLTGNPLLFQKSHVLETQGGIRMKALEPKPARPISARVVQGDSKTTRAKHHASFGALKRAQSAKRVQNTWCGVDEIPNELSSHTFQDIDSTGTREDAKILEEANEKWQLAGELSLRDEDVSTAGVERRWLAEGAGGSEGGVAVDWDAGARDAFCCYQRLFVDDLYLVKAGLFVSRSGHRLPAGFEATAKRGLDRWHVARERVKKAMRVEREASWQSVTKHVFAHELLWRNERRYLETGSLREPYLLPRLSFELLGEPTSHELDTSPQLSARQSPVVINGQTQNKALQTNPHFNSPGPVLAVPTELPAADIPPIASPESPETVQNAANVQIDETGGTCPSQSEANAPTPEIGQLVDIESWNDGGGGFVADVQRGEGRVLLQIAPFGRMPRPAGHVVDPRENGFFQEAKPRDALGRLLRLSAGDQTAFKRIAGLSHSLLSEQSGGDGDVAQPQDDEQADFLRHLASFSHPKRITLPIEMCRWVPDATEPGAMVVVGSTRAALGRKFRDGSRSVLPESDPALPGLRRVAASMKKEAVPQKSAPTPPPPGHWCIQSPAAPRAGENVRVVPTKRGSRLVTLPIISLDEASGFAAVAVPLARPTAAIQPFLWRVEGGELLARFPLAQLRWIPTGRGSEWVFVTAKTEQSKTGWKKSNQPLPKELQSAAGQQRQGGEYAAPDVLPQPRDSAVFAAPSPEVSPRGDSVDHGPPESVYGSVPNKPSASPTDGVPSLAPASVKPRGPKQKAGPPMPDSVRSPTDGASSRALDAKFQHDATCFSDASPSTQQHQQHPFVEESLHRMATKRQQLDLKAVHRKAAEYSDAPPGRPTTPLDCSVSLRNARTTYASGATQQFMPRSIRSHIGDSLVESAKPNIMMTAPRADPEKKTCRVRILQTHVALQQKKPTGTRTRRMWLTMRKMTTRAANQRVLLKLTAAELVQAAR